MGFVLLYLVLSLLASAPVGWALSRFLLGRMPDVPVEYARYRPNINPAVITATAIVEAAHRDLADLYPDPTPRP